MAIWRASDARVYCDVSSDGTINIMKKGRYPFLPGKLSLAVPKASLSDLMFVLDSTLTLFKKGYLEPVVLTQNEISTTVIDWNTCTFTMASKQYKDGISIHILDIDNLLAALTNVH